MSSIQKIEDAIKNGDFAEPVLKYRVYAITTSKEHLKAGADFMLMYSFNEKQHAIDEALEINKKGLDTAVVVW